MFDRRFFRSRKLIAALALCALLAALVVALPSLLKSPFEGALHDAGFPDARLNKISVYNNAVVVDSITLDPDGFSVVDDVVINLNWINAVLHRRVDKISVKKITLAGEVDERGRISIAGYTPGGQGGGMVSSLPLNSLDINGVQLDLDTQAGMIRMEAKATLTAMRGPAGDQWQVMIASWAKQRQLTYDLTVTGTYQSPQHFKLTAEVQDGRAAIEDYAVSRLSGWMDIARQEGAAPQMTGQMNAGSINLPNVAFQDATLVAQMEQSGKPSLLLQAKSVADSRNNLSVTLSDIALSPNFSATIEASGAAPILNTLLPYSPDVLQFSAGTIGLNGHLSAPTNQAESEMMTVSGTGTVMLRDVAGTLYGFQAQGVTGAIGLDQWWPVKTKRSQTIRIEKLDSGKQSLTDANVTFDYPPLSVTQSRARMAGGTIALKPFVWKEGKPLRLVALFDRIDLSTLVDQANVKGLRGDSKLSGTMPIDIQDGKISVHDAVIESQGSGTLAYNPNPIPPSLQGDNPQMETVRQALSDFRFEVLSVSIDGPLDGSMKTILKATGTNPAFGDRPINLNVNLEGALAPALFDALQPGLIADTIEKEFNKKAGAKTP